MSTWVLTPCHQPRLEDLKLSLSELAHPAELTVVVTTLPEPIEPSAVDTAAVLLSSEPGINIASVS